MEREMTNPQTEALGHAKTGSILARPENDTALGRQWVLTGRHVVPKAVVKRLQQRRDGPGLIYITSHLLLIAAAALSVQFAIGTQWLWPAMFMLGGVSVFLFAAMQECWHWTACRTRWINDAVGLLSGMIIARPFFWARHLHTAHHTHTAREGHDTDVVKAPQSLLEYMFYVTAVMFWWRSIGWYWRGLSGRWNDFDRGFLPVVEMSKSSWEIRFHVLLWATLSVVSAYNSSFAFLYFYVIPRLMGEPVMRLFRMAEHAGAERTPNLLASTRTTYTNAVIRFLYWQMPFHAEHHLFPSVPFFSLAELNRYTAPHLKTTERGYWRVHWKLIRNSFQPGSQFSGHSEV